MQFSGKVRFKLIIFLRGIFIAFIKNYHPLWQKKIPPLNITFPYLFKTPGQNCFGTDSFLDIWDPLKELKWKVTTISFIQFGHSGTRYFFQATYRTEIVPLPDSSVLEIILNKMFPLQPKMHVKFSIYILYFLNCQKKKKKKKTGSLMFQLRSCNWRFFCYKRTDCFHIY